MSDERASGVPAENNTGMADGVAGDADGNNSESEVVTMADLNALRSNMDAQVAAKDKQIEKLTLSLQQQQQLATAAQQESIAVKTEGMTPTERAAFERDQALSRLAEYEARDNEAQAKAQFALSLSNGFDVPIEKLMSANSTDEMYQIARSYTREQVGAIQTGVTQPLPANSAAPSGATMQSRQPEPDVNDVRAKALADRDNQAFLRSWRAK